MPAPAGSHCQLCRCLPAWHVVAWTPCILFKDALTSIEVCSRLPHPCVCPAAGLVSLTYLRQPLFGPPFMRQLPPARAFFIGDTSPQSDPVRFVSAVEQLSAWHWDQQQHQAGSIPVPLVVNTAGWVKVGRLHMPLGGHAQGAARGSLEPVSHCYC